MPDDPKKPLRLVRPSTWKEPEQRVSLPFRGGAITGPDEDTVRQAIAEIEDGEARRARWPKDGRQAMTALAQLFPSMRGVPGTDPSDVDQLIPWLNGPAPGSGAASAGRFLLSVWNPGTDWNEFGL